MHRLAADPGLARVSQTYQPHIEGLRAIAVLLVLLYHFKLGGLSGGFLGVDIFFVISGYLITGMLIDAQAEPGFKTLLGFYRRRFWRIAPAYFVTVLVTTLCALWLLLPPDADLAGQSALFSVPFASNVLFEKEAGYFDTLSTYKPLLHTWSLAVEVQFYILWSLILVAILRWRRTWLLAVVAAIALVSLVVSAILSVTQPHLAFFGVVSRLWEFGCGALAVFAARGAAVRWPRLPLLCNLAAISLLVAPWLISTNDLWPLPGALVPVVATAILILRPARGEAIAQRLLASAPMTFIGRISYSLYLVHWPLVVFLSYGAFPPPGPLVRGIALLACVPLAWGLYTFVEQPMRRFGRAVHPSRAVLAGLVATLAITLGGGYIAHARQGLLGVWSPKVEASFAERYDQPLCKQSPTPIGPSSCLLGDASAVPHTLIWGDSHGIALMSGAATKAEADHSAVIVAAKGGCPPIFAVSYLSRGQKRADDCRPTNDQVMRDILADNELRTVVLVARWAQYTETTHFGEYPGKPIYLLDDRESTMSVDATRAVLTRQLHATVAALTAKGIHVVLVAQVPEMPEDAGRCTRMRLAKGADMRDCDVSRTQVDERQAYATQLLASFAQDPLVRILDPKSVLCNANRCEASHPQQPLYDDDNHLSAAGSRLIVSHLFADTPF